MEYIKNIKPSSGGASEYIHCKSKGLDQNIEQKNFIELEDTGKRLDE